MSSHFFFNSKGRKTETQSESQKAVCWFTLDTQTAKAESVESKIPEFHPGLLGGNRDPGTLNHHGLLLLGYALVEIWIQSKETQFEPRHFMWNVGVPTGDVTDVTNIIVLTIITNIYYVSVSAFTFFYL